jgi:hypothetical protein
MDNEAKLHVRSARIHVCGTGAMLLSVESPHYRHKYVTILR